MIMGHMGDTTFFGAKKKTKNISPGQVGDTTFLPGQKTHITTFKCMINRL